MRVVVSHHRLRRVDITAAKKGAQDAAEHIAARTAGRESQRLRLEKVTGANVAELADDSPGAWAPASTRRSRRPVVPDLTGPASIET